MDESGDEKTGQEANSSQGWQASCELATDLAHAYDAERALRTYIKEAAKLCNLRVAADFR